MLCLLSFLTINALAQTTYFVKSGATGTGSSWDNAIDLNTLMNSWTTSATINKVIPSTTLNSIHIYVAEGEYPINFNLQYNEGEFIMQGGFPSDAAGTDLSGYNPANVSRIIRPVGSGARRIFNGNYNGTAAANIFTLKGLTLVNANQQDGSIFYRSSVSAHIQFSLVDCTIENSSGGTVGSLLSFYSHRDCTFLFDKNTFKNNDTYNGAITFSTLYESKVLVKNNLFSLTNVRGVGGAFNLTTVFNTATDNGQIYVYNNIFSCTSVALEGGGLFISSTRNVTVKNNLFLGNNTPGYGGGLYLTSSNAHVEDNFFFQNKSFGRGADYYIGGGGIYWTSFSTGARVTQNVIRGNLFLENMAGSTTRGRGGAAIYLVGTASATTQIDVDKNLFIGNTSYGASTYNSSIRSGGAIYAMAGTKISNLNNNLFYGNKLYIDGVETTTDSDIGFASSNIVAGTINNNKLQLANAAVYNTNVSSKFGTENTFANTEHAGIDMGAFEIDCAGTVTCVKPVIATGTPTQTKVAISTITEHANGWPENINGGALMLDSKNKGFVVTRVQNANDLGTNPDLKGGLVYDEGSKCFKFFDGTKWDCIAKSCDINIFNIIKDYKENNL